MVQGLLPLTSARPREEEDSDDEYWKVTGFSPFLPIFVIVLFDK